MIKLHPKKIAFLVGGLFFISALVAIPIVTIHYNKYDLWYKEEEKVYDVAWEMNGSILILKKHITVNDLSKYLISINFPTQQEINYTTKQYEIKSSIGFHNFVSCFENGVNLMGSLYNNKLLYNVVIVYEENNPINYEVAVSITDITNYKAVVFSTENNSNNDNTFHNS